MRGANTPLFSIKLRLNCVKLGCGVLLLLVSFLCWAWNVGYSYSFINVCCRLSGCVYWLFVLCVYFIFGKAPYFTKCWSCFVPGFYITGLVLVAAVFGVMIIVLFWANFYVVLYK